MYAIAHEKISEISAQNLKRPDITPIFRLPDTGSGKAGQRGVAQTCMVANVRGPSNSVGGPTAGTVYAVKQSEDFSDERIPISVNTTENPSKKRLHKSAFLDPVIDNDEIDYDRQPRPWENNPQDVKNSTSFPEVKETEVPGEAEHVRKIAEKYRDVFSSDLNPTPADLDAMKLNVKEDDWRKQTNARPARPQSQQKNDEIHRQVMSMLDAGLIRPSQAPFWSQVILAPKPNGKWRFCIDYRSLNELTESMGWPIPNIVQMLNRIGLRKPKYFAVLDLTSGFFQAPLDESSSWYTAFITWFGLYEWIRVPMGLKGAPSWFQQQIAVKVLGGLLHTICELYIDDLIIYGSTFEEFCENLEKVLQRLREFRVTLNPEKAQLLMTEVEYVGFILDKEGIEFSEEKKSKALDFTLPLTFKSLKRFMGLAETFHRHIPHFYNKARPLHSLLRGYNEMKNRNKPISWSDEDKQAFNDMQLAIGSAQKLHFVDDSKEVILQTDASDYGIGAALYQVGDDGEKIPIAFISKALVNEQLNWSVPEKEGYSIFYSFCKLEHLLRDIHFLLQTDHKNLTYINYGNSAKILQ